MSRFKKANAGLWDSVQHYSLTYELYCIIIKANTTIGTQKGGRYGSRNYKGKQSI